MAGTTAQYPVAREAVLTALCAHLEPLPYIHAPWEGGAAGFNRVDEWSDIDLQIDADDERVDDALRAVEALAYYHGQTLRPLVEALRIRYSPIRYSLRTRYVYHELPPEVMRRLEPLFFVAGLDDLRARRNEAERLFRETVDAIDLASVAALLQKSIEGRAAGA